MNIELFTLCDYVSNNNGRLTIVDTFDQILADKFPWRAYFGVAIKMNFTGIGEVNANNFSMYIHKDGDDTKIFNAQTPLEDKKPEKMALAGNIKGLIFNESGKYHYKVEMGGDVIVDYIFEVLEKK